MESSRFGAAARPARSQDAVKQALTGPQDLRDEVSAIRSLGLLLQAARQGCRQRDHRHLIQHRCDQSGRHPARPTDANGFASRLVYLGVAKALIHRFGAVQYVFSGTALGQVFISVTAYQPGHTNSNEALRQDLSNALNDFSLTGRYI
jgi:diacylglycerol O-acyltransferase / wax synthase